MRTAIAYLTSLLCHGAVLIPLAHLPAWLDTPPAYSMRHGGPATVSLRALSAVSDEVGDPEETPVVAMAMPQYGRVEPEPMVQIESEVTVRPDPKLAIRPEPKSTMRPEPKAAPTPQPTRGSIPPHPQPSVVKAPIAGSDKATSTPRGVPSTQHVASHRSGPGGADAVTAAGSLGNAGGGGDDQSPHAAPSNPVPPYPPDALARGLEGLVLLRVRIGADGGVEEASVDRSSGAPSLDESALSTVRRHWRFLPATRHGAAVSYEAILPIRFTIRAD